MREYAQAIRERIPMREIADHIGMNVNRQGYAACPFHREKTPSLKIYDGTGGWHCFGCGAHGSVIDFVMQYHSLSFVQTIVKLNAEFSLGLPISKAPTARERKTAQLEQRRREQRQKEWAQAWLSAHSDWQIAFDRWLALDHLKRETAPKSIDDGFPDTYVYALHKLPEAKYQAEYAEDQLRQIERERGSWHERGA